MIALTSVLANRMTCVGMNKLDFMERGAMTAIICNIGCLQWLRHGFAVLGAKVAAM